MNLNITNKEVQDYIQQHLHEDAAKIALQKSPFSNVSSRELAEQLDGKKRCEKKLPLWFSAQGIYFPPKLNIEQASSELTADYKSKLITGDTLIDLTGGFGADSVYFSRTAKEVIHAEQNEELSAIASHNAKKLGAENISFISSNSIEYLKKTDRKFGTIYVDPARRIQSKKVFLLKDTEPDVAEHLPLFLSKADRILIKTSPLFDIQSGLKELRNVSEVHVLSIKNDCKELLWVIDKGFEAEPRVTCAALEDEKRLHFSFNLSAERNTILKAFSNPKKYVFEPDVALLKAGCFKLITAEFGFIKLHLNTHLYTSEVLNSSFIGRSFEVLKCSSFKDFGKGNTVRKANIISRNFPLSPDELKKKFKLQDGGDTYLIFCTGANNELLAIEAKRL